MPDITAKDALNYALQKEMILLYLAVIVGSFLLSYGVNRVFWAYHLPIVARVIRSVIPLIFVVVGFLLGAGGFIGILFKVISDATK